MWHEFAVTKPPCADARAKRYGQFESLAFNCRESLHVGIVEQTHRLAEFRSERFDQIESMPDVVAEVRRGNDFVIANIARETNRDAVERRKGLANSTSAFTRTLADTDRVYQPIGDRRSFFLEHRGRTL